MGFLPTAGCPEHARPNVASQRFSPPVGVGTCVAESYELGYQVSSTGMHVRDRFGGGLGDARFLFLRPNQLHLSNDLERPPHAAQGLHLSSTYTSLPPPVRTSRAPHPVQLLWPACSPISARRGPKSRFSRRLTPLYAPLWPEYYITAPRYVLGRDGTLYPALSWPWNAPSVGNPCVTSRNSPLRYQFIDS